MEMRRDPLRVNPPQSDRELSAVRGRHMGECTGTGTVADAGMRRREKGQAEEADGWQVRATPRWAELRTRRGGGERVKQEDFDKDRLRMGMR